MALTWGARGATDVLAADGRLGEVEGIVNHCHGEVAGRC